MNQLEDGSSIQVMGFTVVSNSHLERGTALVATVTLTRILNSNKNTEQSWFMIVRGHGLMTGLCVDTDDLKDSPIPAIRGIRVGRSRPLSRASYLLVLFFFRRRNDD